jgi:hypothetical protein
MIKYFGGIDVILDYFNPVCMGCYISLFIATINSEELLNTLLPDKCSMMGNYGGSNVGNNSGSSGSNSGSSGNNTYNVGSSSGSSGSNTYNVGSNTAEYSDIDKARAEETRRKILESNRARAKAMNSILPTP